MAAITCRLLHGADAKRYFCSHFRHLFYLVESGLRGMPGSSLYAALSRGSVV